MFVIILVVCLISILLQHRYIKVTFSMYVFSCWFLVTDWTNEKEGCVKLKSINSCQMKFVNEKHFLKSNNWAEAAQTQGSSNLLQIQNVYYKLIGTKKGPRKTWMDNEKAVWLYCPVEKKILEKENGNFCKNLFSSDGDNCS